jgi:Uma2 family endonuclease
MSTVISAPETIETLADLLDRLGDIPLRRIRFRPPVGTATEQDVLDVHAREKRLCELVDGVLVEKAVGFAESCLAVEIGRIVKNFVKPRKLGLVAGADGMMRLTSGLVRIPDVSFVAWEQIPGGCMPEKPIPQLAPTLAVEVLSEGNTEQEMERKRQEYFAAGTRLAWIVDPVTRTVRVYTSVDEFTVVEEEDTLDGGAVLPGFTLPLRELFAELDEEATPPPPKPRKRRKGG